MIHCPSQQRQMKKIRSSILPTHSSETPGAQGTSEELLLLSIKRGLWQIPGDLPRLLIIDSSKYHQTYLLLK